MSATKKQRKIIGEYVRWVANELELRDWTIVLSHKEPDDPDHGASIRPTYGQKKATLKLRNDFFGCSLEEQRQTIAHELLHCHTSGIRWQFNNIGNNLSAPLFDAIWSGINDQIEFATEAIADAIAKHLPVPKQAKAKP
jgi:hypothetical protein